jgi:hypothetical protein
LIEAGKDAVESLIPLLGDFDWDSEIRLGQGVVCSWNLGAFDTAGGVELLKVETVQWSRRFGGAGCHDWIPILRSTAGNEEVHPPAMRAALVLERIGAGAVGALPALIRTAYDRASFRHLTLQAVSALERIAPRDPRVLALAIDLLAHDSDTIRERAAELLIAAPDEAFALVRDGLLRYEDTVEGCVYVLGFTKGERRPLAVELVLRHATWPESYLSRQAASALVQLVPAAVPALCQALDDARRRTVATAVLALIGRDARQAAPRLIGQLKSDEPLLVLWSADALARLQPEGEARRAAVAGLEHALRHHEPIVRAGAARALGSLR